jgi:hypothetical protein
MPEHGVGGRLGAAARRPRREGSSAEVEQRLDARVAANDELQRFPVQRCDEAQRARALDVIREQREVRLTALDHLDRGEATRTLEGHEVELGHVALERAGERLAEREEGPSARARRDADGALFATARAGEAREEDRGDVDEGVRASRAHEISCSHEEGARTRVACGPGRTARPHDWCGVTSTR